MNVVVTLEARFVRTPDGAIWTKSSFARPFWDRYLEVFEGVRVVARVHEVANTEPGWKRADGENVSFVSLPSYSGVRQYLRLFPNIGRIVRSSVSPSDSVIMRVGSPIAASLEPLLRRSGRPYGVEVLGDPYDVFAPGAVRHPLRSFFRWWFTRQLKRQCEGASAAAYVTENALQRRYPASRTGYTTYYSDVELSDLAYSHSARTIRHGVGPICLIMVGSLAQVYKAPDVLIDAVRDCAGRGLDLTLTIVGDGKYRTELEARAGASGIDRRICFTGELPAGEAIRNQLDRSDLFVLPSRTEGLPRAMIEAMARALPCIGSTVGGIPELLPDEDLVPPGDVGALAAKIREVASDPERMARMSARNLEKAREYRERVLDERRLRFYRHVKMCTEEWIKKGEGN